MERRTISPVVLRKPAEAKSWSAVVVCTLHRVAALRADISFTAYNVIDSMSGAAAMTGMHSALVR